MARQPKAWWNKRKGTWCSDIGGERHTLAKGKRNKRKAEEKLKALLAEQDLLADVNGSVTVARHCEEFLADTQENLEPKPIIRTGTLAKSSWTSLASEMLTRWSRWI